MTPELQIMCINKADRFNPHRHIIKVGGIANGKQWKITEEEAIQHIEAKTYDFYVLVFGIRTNVIVAWHNGRKYLKTVPDGIIPNNLLSLPECP